MEENRVQATEQQMMLSCLQTMLANQKKSQRRQRIQLVCVIVAACAMLAMFAGVMVFGSRAVATLESTADNLEAAVATVSKTMENVNTLAEELQEVDYETLTENVNALTEAGTKGINEALSDLKSTMTNVQRAIENVNKLDIDSLNKSIEQMGTIMEGIQKWYDGLPSILKSR